MKKPLLATAFVLSALAGHAQQSIHGFVGVGNLTTSPLLTRTASVSGLQSATVTKESSPGAAFSLGGSYHVNKHVFGVSLELGSVSQRVRTGLPGGQTLTMLDQSYLWSPTLNYSYICFESEGEKPKRGAFLWDFGISYNWLRQNMVQIAVAGGSVNLDATAASGKQDYSGIGFSTGPSLVLNSQDGRPALQIGARVFTILADNPGSTFTYTSNGTDYGVRNRGNYLGTGFVFRWYLLNRGLNGSGKGLTFER